MLRGNLQQIRFCSVLVTVKYIQMYTCQLFLSQRRGILILRIVKVSEEDPTISEGF